VTDHVQTRDSGQGGGHTASPRDRILERIRRAGEDREGVPHPGALQERTAPAADDSEALAALFSQTLGQSGAEVVVLSTPETAEAWLRGFCASFQGAAVAGDVPAALRPPLPDALPSSAGLAVSMASAAAAATGSLLLSSREGRALQLLPAVHLVWVEARRLHRDLGAALEAVRQEEGLPAVVALHSGPSKSADIGRILVTGVHGPGRLVAAIMTFRL